MLAKGPEDEMFVCKAGGSVEMRVLDVGKEAEGSTCG